MSKDELLTIVHKIELMFHMAEFVEDYQGVVFQPKQTSLLDSLSQKPSEVSEHFTAKENGMLEVIMKMHHKSAKRLAINKYEYSKLTVREI